MTALAADVLAVWLVVTAACSVLLLLVVTAQAALDRGRRSAVRRRARRGTSRPRTGVVPAAGPAAPR